MTVLFRPPNNPYIGKKVFDFRAKRMGKLVPSRSSARAETSFSSKPSRSRPTVWKPVVVG
ncbi:lipid A biosynthesis lauroyl acyltransferase [compost metagenome]